MLDEAARLLHERGYMGTSMDDIADAVGLTKGSLYHHFPSKAAILCEIYEEAVDFVVSNTPRFEQAESASDAVRGVVHAILELIAANRHQVTVFYQEMRWLDEWLPVKDARRIRKRIRDYILDIGQIIQRGIDSGEFREVDVSTAAYALVGMSSWTYQWFVPDKRISADEVTEIFTSIFLRGVAS